MRNNNNEYDVKERIGPLSILIIIAFTLAAIYFAGCLGPTGYEDEGEIIIDVIVDKTSYSIEEDGPMAIKVTLRNTRSSDFDFDAPNSGPVIRFDIKDSNGSSVYRDHKLDEMVLDVLTPQSFAEGSTTEVLSFSWNFTQDLYWEDDFAEDPNEGKTVPPGEYTLEAALCMVGPEPEYVVINNASITLTK